MGLMSLIKVGGKIVTGAVTAYTAYSENKEFFDNVGEKARHIAGDGLSKFANSMEKAIDKIDTRVNEKFHQSHINMLKEIGKENETRIIIDDNRVASWTYETAVKYNRLEHCVDNYYIATLYNKYGVIDTDENIIVPFEYNYLGYYGENLIVARDNSSKCGFINLKNEIIIDFIFDDANRFCCNLAPVCSEDKYGYVDENGDFTIPPKYDYAGPFNKNGLSCVRLGKFTDCKHGVIDTNGDTVVNCHYNSIEIYNDYIKCYNGDYFADDSKCYFDLKGKPIEINESEKRKNYSSHKSIPYNDSNLKYGHYIKTDDGDYCVIKPTFDEEFYFNDAGYAIVKLNGLYGIIKKESEV